MVRDGGRVDKGWKREACLERSLWTAGIGWAIVTGVSMEGSILMWKKVLVLPVSTNLRN